MQAEADQQLLVGLVGNFFISVIKMSFYKT